MKITNLIPLKAFKKLENWALYLKWILEPLKKISFGYSPFPVVVIAHITYRCNFDCTICCQHIPDYAEILPTHPIKDKREEEISLNDWKKIIDNLKSSFKILPFFHISGGEPFLYPNVIEIIRYAKEKGFSTSLITNGWHLKNYADELIEMDLDRLHISIDGPEEIHDNIRKVKGAYRKAIEGIRYIKQKRDMLKKKKPHITINCTITNENNGNLKEMIKVKEESRADYLTFQHLVFFDNEKNLSEKIDVEKLIKQFDDLKKERHKFTIYPYVPKKYWKEFYFGSCENLRKGCGWNWVGLRLHPNGDVVPCRGIYVGNPLKDNLSLKEIWNNKEFKILRKEIAKIGNAKECGRCTHRLF